MSDTRRKSSARIRMVAIDLDGTLLTSTKKITAQTADALKAVATAGIKIVIASARPPRSVRTFYEQLGLDTLTINYNGALIWDEPRKTPHTHLPMPPGLVRRIILFARDMFPEVLASCEVLDRWYTDRHDPAYTTETGRIFKPDLVAPMDEFLGEPVTKLMLLGDPDMITLLHDFVQTFFEQHCTAIRADPELIQVMNSRASKAIALKAVAGHYGVALEEVMAIGDAANDVPMLQAAGIAVAMDNAHPLVKEAADWIAPSNDNHGVAAALTKFVLQT
ncbi:MAG: Cof-type HAD-IIB family hydrolase [Tepidisphaerales bacterium]